MNACQITADSPKLRPDRLASWSGLLEFEKTLFVVVNMLDVIVTCQLLNTGSFYESNPVAQFFLAGWGMMGMIAFKLILVGLVMAIANVVAIWRLGTARGLLYFGTLVTGLVVMYSLYLMAIFSSAAI